MRISPLEFREMKKLPNFTWKPSILMKWIFSFSFFFPQENFKLWNSAWKRRASGKYSQRWNDDGGSLALEQTILMILLPWVSLSSPHPHVHFSLSNVLGPVEERMMFSGSWNEVRVMKFCQLKFRRKLLSSCWDTASSWESNCVTSKGA